MKLVDVRALHKKNPYFDLPSEIGDIIVGDFVELMTPNEKTAWVKVTRRKGSRFTGKPVQPGDLDDAKSVSFTTRNIYNWTEAGSNSISTWVKTGDSSMPVSSPEPVSGQESVSLVPSIIVVAAVIGYKLLSR